MYQDIEFDIENFKSKIGIDQLMYNNKVSKNSFTKPYYCCKQNYLESSTYAV